MTKSLLIVTAWIEAAVGLALLASPSMPVWLLLDASLEPPGAVVARVAGAALLALGLACWLSRYEGHSRAGRAVIGALLVYNLVVVGVLVHARLGLDLAGIGLWPAVGLHVALAAWGLACLSRQRVRAPAGPTTQSM